MIFNYFQPSRACFTLLAILLCLAAGQHIVAQGLDCNEAGVICEGTTIVYNPVGSGRNDFSGGTNRGCLSSGENLSAWYFFEMNDQTPPNTVLTFIIRPDQGAGQDYDFAVWGPTTVNNPLDCSNLGNPIRCSYAASGAFGNGSTGLATS